MKRKRDDSENEQQRNIHVGGPLLLPTPVEPNLPPPIPSMNMAPPVLPPPSHAQQQMGQSLQPTMQPPEMPVVDTMQSVTNIHGMHESLLQQQPQHEESLQPPRKRRKLTTFSDFKDEVLSVVQENSGLIVTAPIMTRMIEERAERLAIELDAPRDGVISQSLLSLYKSRLLGRRPASKERKVGPTKYEYYVIDSIPEPVESDRIEHDEIQKVAILPQITNGKIIKRRRGRPRKSKPKEDGSKNFICDEIIYEEGFKNDEEVDETYQPSDNEDQDNEDKEVEMPPEEDDDDEKDEEITVTVSMPLPVVSSESDVPAKKRGTYPAKK